MDEQTFRRLAPDAVAGRLDAETYAQWKAATGQSEERAAFVVRIAEADARFSGEYGPVREVAVSEPAAPVSKRVFLSLSLFFAVFGLVAGGLVMNSCIATNNTIARKTNQPGASANAPASQPTPTNEPAAPANNPRPEPLPEPEPEPLPEAEPETEPELGPQATTGLVLERIADGFVSIRGRKDDTWRKLAPGEPIPDGATLGKTTEGVARFNAPGLLLIQAGAGQFEYDGTAIRFISGRYQVRVHSPFAFACYKAAWSAASGAFIVEPRTLGGDLFLIEGSIEFGAAPLYVNLDGTGRNSVLSAGQLRELEAELLGPHRRLLWWDGESAATTPGYGTPVAPGALGDGHAIVRASGDPGIGVRPAIHVFDGEDGARLRLRVKTDAKRLRLELRLHLDDGYRAVDAEIDVPVHGEWCLVDVPMHILRAGRMREESGWLPGRAYSALLLTPGVDVDNLLRRHELAVDDLLVYVPE